MNRANKLALISALLLLMGPVRLFSQELPRPSMTRHESTATLPSDYNLKLGPVLVTTNASIEGEYVDNIALAQTGAKSDFILTPQIGIGAQWPITESNNLRLSTSLGYSKYMIHPQYDQGQLLVSPDSVLSFDIYVGDFKINFHDQFSYQQDPSSVGAVSNVVNFNRFQNVAGVGGIWDLNKLILTLNYDHINFISDELQTVGGNDLANPSNVSYSADQVSASGYYRFTTTFIGGLEAAASMRNYDNNNIQDNQLSAGPFFRIEVTPNVKVSLSGGFQTISTDSGDLTAASVSNPNSVSPALGVGTQDSYYANVTLDHRFNKYYTDRLAVGHELELDVFSQESDVTYASYTSDWKVNNELHLALTLNFQDVSSPSTGGTGTPSFDLFGAALQANFPVTKSISGAVLYQFNDKFNTPSSQGYLQDRVGLLLNYHF
jgi:hypothetical protein